MNSEETTGPAEPTPHDGTPAANKRHCSRRRFLKWTLRATAAAVVGGGLYSWRIEPHWIQVVRLDLPIENLPGELAGRTLGLIADLHVGTVVDDDYIRAAMRRVNALKPDLLAVVGDFMSSRGDEQIGKALDVVGLLDRPPLGAFAALGNHDYGRGWRSPAVAAKLAAGLSRQGFTVLRNEMATVRGLQIVGLDDLWAHEPSAPAEGQIPGGGDFDMPKAGQEIGPSQFFDPARVMPRLDPGRAAIVLVHNPDAVDQAGWAGYRGWVLAGHTHGGQVDLPLIGPPMLSTSNKSYVRGEYALSDGRRMYITRGLGYLRRVRLFSRPEITLFTLKCAPEAGR